MPMVEQIRQKLTAALNPTHMRIEDQSDQHIGHAGWAEEGETHFYLEIVSPNFTGLSRVARQRLVYTALQDELAGSLHALSFRTCTPEEDQARKAKS